MKHKFKKFRQGFSLVELVIVMAIITIMTVVLFVSMSNKKAVADVDVAVRQVAAQLRVLQNEALSGKQIDGKNVCKYEFDAPIGSSYTIKYSDCAASPSVIDAGTQSVDFTKKRVSFIGSDVNLYFSSPLGNVDGVKTIKIKSTTASVCMSVEVLENGSITEQKIPCS